MVSVPCYRCNRYHRIVPLVIMLVISRMGCYYGPKIIPSFLTLKEGSTFLTKPLFNSLYAPFGSPSSGGQKPQGREVVTALQCCICPTCPSPAGGSLTHSQALALSKRARDVTALRCSEPLRFMVVGPSKVCAMLCGMGPPGERWIGLLKCWFGGNLLITCRFLAFSLVVSRKKRIFATVS